MIRSTDSASAGILKTMPNSPIMPVSRGQPLGLYSPAHEHDACGVGFVVDMHGRSSRELVETALGALCNLEHRGALGAEVNTGDGAGVLIQVPDAFFKAAVDFPLPEAKAYATGIAFLPQDSEAASRAQAAVEGIVRSEGLEVLGWRDVPADSSMLGEVASDDADFFAAVRIRRRLFGPAAARHRS